MPDKDITPFPVDDESTLNYLKNKIPDWHNRLQSVERSCTDTQFVLVEIKKQVGEIHTAMLGSIDGNRRGLFARMEIVEIWKKTMTWALSVLYGAFIASVVGMVISKL